MKIRNFVITAATVMGLFAGVVGLSFADNQPTNTCGYGKGSSCESTCANRQADGKTAAPSGWEKINRGQ